jgi:Mg2+ and Co2+ transporter CorA
MHIVEITADSMRFADAPPEAAPDNGFVWIYLDRADFSSHTELLQQTAQRLGGSALLDVHLADLMSELHPSNYDATSIYDIVIFRRLASLAEVQRDADAAAEPGAGAAPHPAGDIFARIASHPVGFAVFDKLVISVHSDGCHTAQAFIQRLLADAKLSVDTPAAARNRVPQSTVDLVLRMINVMVDGYLELRKDLATALERVQQDLLAPRPRRSAWRDVIHARRRLQLLEDLCEEQQDAMQEWLDTLHDLPLSAYAADPALAQGRRDQLVARARDIIEHIDRVLHHARRLEQSAETAVQIHFGAQGQRTNDIMRTLTAVTAIFLPLNLFTGFFGMNFEHLPLIHSTGGMWSALILLVLLAVGILVLFWRRGYISRSRR